jgi:hypothetical protein
VCVKSSQKALVSIHLASVLVPCVHAHTHTHTHIHTLLSPLCPHGPNVSVYVCRACTRGQVPVRYSVDYRHKAYLKPELARILKSTLYSDFLLSKQ